MVAVDMQCVTSAAGEGSGRGVGMHGHAPAGVTLLRSNLEATPMCLGLNDSIKLSGDERRHLTELFCRLWSNFR